MALFGFGQSSMTLGHAPARLPSLSFADPIRDVIVKATGLTADSKPRLLDGLRIRFKFAAKKESKEDRNVIGLFPGTDPEKAKEVVIFSAHYDHVGVNEKGEIFNGSDDNASGTSALLEIAEAFGDGPRPARSVAFLWVSGEEKGLLGSQWFSDHVTLPASYKIIADINLDMVSRNDAKTIGITPSDRHADYSTLIPAAQAAAKEEGLATKFDADAFFFRTDSYNFARKGIPVIFFFCGVHEDYHRSTDDVAKADFEKAARVARTAYRLGWQVAQEKETPRKIKPGSDDNEAKTSASR
jgi:Zn-dependent M28 family amino/carboxypeptidase